MARKSRKGIIPTPKIDTNYHAAIYIRLSVQDKQCNSSSIETQKLIISQFIELNPDIKIYNTYIDNGLTGTNFQRPAFQQMLSDIETGHINCVIVKDLSRLGRNVIDTGYYIERYFPTWKIRFISVNDHYDSLYPIDSHSCTMLPIRNMINEAYSLDIGRKIKMQQRQAMKEGKYIGSRTPYGYLKSPNDCHKLIIDPFASKVVKQIFDWAYDGLGLNAIAVRLNEAGYPTPSHYKKMLGEINNDNMLGSGNWQTWTLEKIITSPVYTGNLIQGLSKTVDHKQVKANPDEWIVVKDTHEAIISHELFNAVQEKMKTHKLPKNKKNRPWSPNLFKGKIFCAHCGGNLHREKRVRKKTGDTYIYKCISNNRIKKGACLGVFIFEKELICTLIDIIKQQLDTILGQYHIIMENHKLTQYNDICSKIASRQLEIKQLRNSIRNLYENLIQNTLTKDKYFSLKNDYESKIKNIHNELNQLEQAIEIIKTQQLNYNSLSEYAKNISQSQELTAIMVNRIIDHIQVSKERQITVHFCFESEFERSMEVLNKCKNM